MVFEWDMDCPGLAVLRKGPACRATAVSTVPGNATKVSFSRQVAQPDVQRAYRHAGSTLSTLLSRRSVHLVAF